MDKEFHIIDVGFIGSYIEERADNDGDNLSKNVSLNVGDNGVYVIDPITGLLKSIPPQNATGSLQFVQLNADGVGSPTSNLIIKNIGKTIKVINVTNTEICVNTKLSGSNYSYESSSMLPEGAKDCLKSIYFTSNHLIHWPTTEQTNAVLEDLSKKIPNDQGFSKKEYKIVKLSDKQLKHIEQETKISHHFLKKLHTLALFDSEYPDNIENSKIKLSNEWDGFSVDKNNHNNLVYSDYFKTGSAEYTNYVFLVTDRTLNDLHHYFVTSSEQKSGEFERTTIYNPDEWIMKKNERKENYGQLIHFKTLSEDGLVLNKPTEDQVLDILSKKEVYKIDPSITDLDLVQDVVATDVFMDIVENTNLFVINKYDEDRIVPIRLLTEEALVIQQNMNLLNPIIQKYEQEISLQEYTINRKVFELIKKYFNFQLNNDFPRYESIGFVKDKFQTLFSGKPFVLNDSNGFEIESEPRTKTFLPEIDSSGVVTTVDIFNPQVELTTDTTASANINFSVNDVVIPFQDTTPIMKRLEFPNDYAESDTFFITKNLFSDSSDRQNEFYTGSAPSSHVKYYLPVYTKLTSDPFSKYVFNISYAHISGSGSSYYDTNNAVEHLPSKTMYKKYLAECFGNQSQMIFKNGIKSDYFYIIEFNRNVFKDRLDSQNIQISLSPISSSQNQLINTGSNFSSNPSSSTIYTLIDNSKTMIVYSSSMFGTEEYYDLMEGTQQDGLKYNENANSWGMIFPKRGLILLDGQVLDQSCSFNTVTASVDGDNIRKLFISISSSCVPNSVRNTNEYWYVRSAELYSDQNYFCRVGQNEFNYSNNYTYVSGSTRKFLYDKVNNSTKTYITSIGLYDDDKNLLAVGKLKKSLLKDSGQEYVFNIKIKSN